MACIANYWFVRHLRAESASHVLHYRAGKLRQSGRGVAFWFSPQSATLAEIPVDDRELTLTIHARTSDYQDVSGVGVVTIRILDAEAVARRIDFSIDNRTGAHVTRPLEKLHLAISELAQQHAAAWITKRTVREVLALGPEQVRERIHEALGADAGVTDLGLAVVSVRVSSFAPVPELERALEAPMREKIQQESDEAAFARRAMAVEKERAIAENELQSRIELARREEQLIAQQGENQKRQATLEAESRSITSESEANRARALAGGQAESIRLIEGAKVEQERARMQIQERVPPAVLAALAAREVAGKLQRIEHLHLGGGSLGPLLSELASAGTRALEERERDKGR